MAVVKANYVKRGVNERATAKANIRYIQQRPGRDKEKLTRTLFGAAGVLGRYEAYQFIDAEATEDRYFYRLKLSPDPKAEDTQHDLPMQKLTRQMMQGLEKRLHTAIPWAAALHDDHTPIRHVHILAAIPRRLHTHELEFLIREATDLALAQRRGLDLSATKQKAGHERPFSPRFPTYHSLKRARLAGKAAPSWAPSHTGTTAAISSPMRRGGMFARIPTASCTCPRCHFPQTHDRHRGIHSCLSCGLMLHKKKGLSVQRDKGRGLERTW